MTQACTIAQCILLHHLWCDCLGALGFQLCQTRPHHLSPKERSFLKSNFLFSFLFLHFFLLLLKCMKWMLVPDSRLSPQFLECSNDVSQSNLQACIIFNCIYKMPGTHGFGSGSKKAKMTHKYRRKERIFMFWIAGCSLLRVEVFSSRLCVLYGGNFWSKKCKKKFSSCKFFKFWVIKTLDPELDLDPDPKMDPDPQLEKLLDQDPHPH